VNGRLLTPLWLFALLIPAVLANDLQAPQDLPAEVPATNTAQPNGNTERVSKRLFGFIPNYRASDPLQAYVHPTVREKFKIARQNSFDWPVFFTTAGYALQNQVSQQGWHAFGRNFAEYYARAYADNVIGNYVTQAILPSMLGEDPRYYRSGVGSGWSRTWHAISQVAITRGVNGNKRIHLSELAGNAGVVAVTNLYYPSEHHDLGSSMGRWGLAIGNDAIANLLNEFLPDLERKLRHH
jgi:hypothetical protein